MAEQYRGRINTAVDYIEKNLNHNFSLDEIASVAGFSKYHFHRIFYIFTGESLFQFIQRLRLEKAATLLLTDPVKPVTEIALECGFSNSSSFASLAIPEKILLQRTSILSMLIILKYGGMK